MTELRERVVVVVVAYGRPDLVRTAIATLAGTTDVLVVDNSAAPLADEVRCVASTAGARYLPTGANLGFAGGVNTALRVLADDARDVLVLNPDARLDAGQLSRLLDVLQAPGHERVAALSPALVGADGRPQQVRWPFPSPGGMWREALGLHRVVPSADAEDGFVIGAVLLLRREAIDDVGPFDERYFLYAEEADWQRRAAVRGWRSLVADDVTATHQGAATAPDERSRERLFHAAHETFLRQWFSPTGWSLYRLGAWVGAAVRGAVLPGDRGAAARRRAQIFRRGPARCAPLPTVRPLRITHVIVTANFAGTERYVVHLAREQAVQGHDVVVVGGDRDAMNAALAGSAVRWRAGASIPTALAAVVAGGSRDVVHTHLTYADFVAALTGAWHGARVISTRHIAARRGSSSAAHLAALLLERRIDAEIFVSEFVRAVSGRPGTVVPSGVPEPVPGAARETGRRTVLIAQRLELDKDTATALAGWRASGLGDQGWTLAVAGIGSQFDDLTRRFAGPSVDWLGWVPDLEPVLRQSTALLAPAPQDSFGLSVVEAMSLAVPVVASAAGGHLETVGRVGGALLFPAGDVAACAQALQKLAAMSPDERADYGEQLQQEQRRRFTGRAHARAVEAVYRAPQPTQPRP